MTTELRAHGGCPESVAKDTAKGESQVPATRSVLALGSYCQSIPATPSLGYVLSTDTPESTSISHLGRQS